ncbi:hypothetical protein [Prevotella falsenii]|uniref:hypothetical protein n=1 Tax=Prevotella falsenii TaxID=515414 RepID=UPI0004699B47|nr:hypothetical protein [Prevotella falsenii]
MAKENRKRKFTSTLTFKILLGILVLFVLGLFYNFIIAEDDVVSEQEKQEEQQRKAALDTVDVVGDYLWSSPKPRKEDLTTDDEKTKAEAEIKKMVEEARTNAAKKAKENNNAASAPPTPLPAPAVEPVPAKPATAPLVEKMSAPKIEKIEQ